MEDFAKRYHECNPDLSDNSDRIYAVAFSLLLLHTDAHNKNVRQKMNKDTFIMRTRIIEGGEDVPAEILDIMYDNIVSTEFTYAEGGDDDLFRARTPTSWFGRLARSDSSSTLAPANMTEDLYPKLTQLMPPENTFCYKRILRPIQLNDIHMAFHQAKPLNLGGVRGRHYTNNDGSNTYTIRVAKAAILERKYDMLPGGKKTTARGWRPFGVILSGTQIIFFADVLQFDSWLATEEQQEELKRQQQQREREVPRHSTTPTHSNNRPMSERSSSSSPSSSTAPHSYPMANNHHSNTSPSNPFRFPSVSTSTVDSTSQTASFTSSIYSTQSLTHSIIPASPSTPTNHHPSNNGNNNNLLRPVQIISLSDAVCIYDESYTKYSHVFRLITGDGQLFLLRAKNNADLDDWMMKINYAATIKTTGVRLKPSSSTSSSESSRRYNTHNNNNNHHQNGPKSIAVDRIKREEKAKAKVLEISHKMVELERLLERDLQLRRNLMVLVPLQKPSKERILYFADIIGKRVYSKRLEMQRLECYREFMETALMEMNHSTTTTRKMSAPLLSRSLVPANLLAAHRSATTPAIGQLGQQQQQQQHYHHYHQLPPPRSYTVSPMPFEDDVNDGEVMWSQSGQDTPSSSSEMLKPSTASSSEDDERSARRSSCPQIPPFPFAMEEISIPKESATGALQATLEKSKDKTVAFDVPSSVEADTNNSNHNNNNDKATSKWMRRRSCSNPVKPQAANKLGRERSGSEASSVRDDDELTIVNLSTGDDDLDEKNHHSDDSNRDDDDDDEDIKNDL
ncbi:hypothetical protein BDC45DRAFT_299273 [Circinella umbellata]|nr:hypothetical protein BDC45DRAFT_299273 [Circinella umbellata]